MKKYFLIIALFAHQFSFSQHWQQIGNFDNDVSTIYCDTIDSCLYVGGYFQNVNNQHQSVIAKYKNGIFETLPDNILNGSYVHKICRFQNKIYVGGDLRYPNYNTPVGLCFNADTAWIPPDDGVNGNVELLYNWDSILLVGGLFTWPTQNNFQSLIYWNGTTWNCFDPNLCFLSDFLTFGKQTAVYIKGSLYVGGQFYLVNADTVYTEITRWNGSYLENVGTGIHGVGWVSSIIEYKNEIYAAGYFHKSEGNAGNLIQKWNGFEWKDVGGGLYPGQVFDMVVWHDNLYVVGSFQSAGGVPAQQFARWDGQKWCGFNTYSYFNILSVDVYNDELYIGGSFEQIGNDSVSYVAKWLGGNYTDTCSQVFSVSEIANETEINIFPNPATNYFKIITDNTENQTKTVNIYTIEGVLIKQVKYTDNEIMIETNEFPAGIFIIELKSKEYSCYKKVVITK